MKKTKLTLQQETVRLLNNPAGPLGCSIAATRASICNICIPPTESPDCNPAILPETL